MIYRFVMLVLTGVSLCAMESEEDFSEQARTTIGKLETNPKSIKRRSLQIPEHTRLKDRYTSAEYHEAAQSASLRKLFREHKADNL